MAIAHLGLFKADILGRKSRIKESDVCVQWVSAGASPESGLSREEPTGWVCAVWHPTTAASLSQGSKVVNSGALHLADPSGSIRQTTELKLLIGGFSFLLR